MSTNLINEQVFDDKLAQLEGSRTWSPRVISKLETFIRTADDFSLFRINPVQFATEKGMQENEAINLFLYATKFGLFEMDWHLVCASCGCVVENFRDLSHLHGHYVCSNCFLDQTAALDDYIRVSFTVAPQIRDIRFRHPELLSPNEFYFQYLIVYGATLPDGMRLPDFMKQSAKVMETFAPGENKTLEFDVIPGILLMRTRTRGSVMPFLVNDAPLVSAEAIPLLLVDGKFQTPNVTPVPQVITVGYVTLALPQVNSLPAGKVVVEIRNTAPVPSDVLISNMDGRPAITGQFLQFDPFLSGKKLLTTQSFRELFRTEVVQSSEGIGVKDITFLFTDLKGSTALYDLIGDPKAYYLVRQHFDTLGRVIDAHSGAVVKTIGDAVMATFMNPADAVGAAVEMLKEIELFNRGISEDLILKVGIHSGHSIVVTLNDRLDYFGQTVNIAARVQGLAEAGEIYISQDAYRRPGVSDVVAGCEVTASQASVKGVSEMLQVYRIAVKH